MRLSVLWYSQPVVLIVEKISLMINKISDIRIGEEYMILLAEDKNIARKCIVRAIINDQTEFKSGKTEIYVELFKDGKWSSTNLLYFSEIGIGEDAGEALRNYGRFNYEENPGFDSSVEEAKKKSQFN